MTLNEYLSQVRERAGKATPGPWRAYCRAQDEMEIHTATGGVMFRSTSYGLKEEDSRLVAASRTDVPKLALIAEKLHKALEEIAEVPNRIGSRAEIAAEALAEVENILKEKK